MGATKTEHFKDQQNRMAILCKALGHPARVAIVEYLLQVNECICGDIVNELPLSQSTVSQHLRELKNAGIIKGEIEGNSICYCIEIESIKSLKNYFSEVFNSLTYKKTNC